METLFHQTRFNDLHQLADKIHQLSDVVFGVGRGEAQQVELFLDAFKSGEMRRMLLLTLPRSVADAIDIATELFSTEAASVRAVTG